MTVSEQNFVSVSQKPASPPVSQPPINSNPSTSTAQRARWHLYSLELQSRVPLLPSQVTQANPADPRLKPSARLPGLSVPVPANKDNLASTSTEENKSAENKSPPAPTKSAARRRPRLQLNENANTFATNGVVPQPAPAPPPGGILDPRLLKRRKMEVTPVPTSSAQQPQPSTSQAMQVVSSPQ